MIKILETDRLYLRPLHPDDRDALMRVLSDPESMRFYPHPFSPDEVEQWINWNIENYERYQHGLWAVILKDSDVFIGDCGITMQTIGEETLPEIGFHVIREFCCRGYATEAALACMEYAFCTLKYPAVFSYTSLRNVPSRRVAEKLGMQPYKYFEKNGETQVVHTASRD